MSVPVRMTPGSKASCAGVGAVGQRACRRRGLRRRQVMPLLLDAGYFVVNAACLCAGLCGGRDEETPSWEDVPLGIGHVALTRHEQALLSGLGRAEGWFDHFGDEAVPGRVDGRQLELFLGAEQGMQAALGRFAAPASRPMDRPCGTGARTLADGQPGWMSPVS